MDRSEKQQASRRRFGRSGPRAHPQDQPPGSAGRYAAAGDGPLAVNSRLVLQEPFKIDLALVRRLERRQVNPKEAFTIRDGSGAWFRAAFTERVDGGGLALPYERMERSPEPGIDITLGCAVLARQRMLFVMQKATELGVMRIVPLLTEYSVPAEGLQHENAHAWPGHVTRAAKQCRRSSLPQVLPPMTLDVLLGSPVFAAADLRLFLDDRSEPGRIHEESPRHIILLVGPEGGFSDAERARLAGKARPWFLGGRVLRAETAVVVGLTAAHMTWGDFRGATDVTQKLAGKGDAAQSR